MKTLRNLFSKTVKYSKMQHYEDLMNSQIVRSAGCAMKRVNSYFMKVSINHVASKEVNFQEDRSKELRLQELSSKTLRSSY